MRDIQPGEIVVINAEGPHSIQGMPAQPIRACIYEYIYYSHPASVFGGQEVYKARYNMGCHLAKEAPADADAVVWYRIRVWQQQPDMQIHWESLWWTLL